MKRVKVAPSLLAADWSRVGQEALDVEKAGADLLHLDVMDGRFVPNITFGVDMVKALGRCTELPLDVHLMIVEPEKFVEGFAKAGADIITVHAEASVHLHRLLEMIREHGVKAGVSVNPGTPLGLVEPVLSMIDLLLIMTVNPGFGGQTFIAGMEQKVKAARKLLTAHHSAAELQVDGGVNADTAPCLIRGGASILVAGSFVFGHQDRAARIRALRG